MTLTQTLTQKFTSIIHQQSMKPGDMFPSEFELAKRFHASRFTIREAIRQLVDDGILYRVQGKGTYIAPGKYEVDTNKKIDFDEIAESMHQDPVFKIISITKGPQGMYSHARAQLQNEDHLLWVIEMLRCVGDTPLILSQSFISANRFPDFEKNIDTKHDIYSTIKEKYKFNTLFKEPYTLEVRAPLYHEMIDLQISRSIPVFVLQSRTHAEDNTILEFRISVSRSDMIKFTNLRLDRAFS